MNDEDRLADLLLAWEDRFEQGEDVPVQDLCRDCPSLVPTLAKQVQALKKIAWVHEGKNDRSQPDDTTLGHRGMQRQEPQHIGRYRVQKVLGNGGFGVVYLALDEQLQRLVAIKVPHQDRMSTAEAATAYLTEARTVANLDHPHIVPVFDVGSAEDCPCFIVSKFIEGTDLATRLKQSRLSVQETTELIATIAEALHYAHGKGLVHRDIKPSNILLDSSGKSFVADFGLALREQDVGTGPRYAGTPAYMSPEQARGEGHRVDGRSDIFSLSVIFYELLAGRHPFRANSKTDLMEQITTFEPLPPRQYDKSLSHELERICLKGLSKRASERYMMAKDMADDLRHFLIQQPSPRTNSGQHVKIVPKGLRSFEAHDADFFLELLPGPRDRNGLPDSIRFWKTRIEETDTDNTFSVGLIYGPSGCGKSSLVKAGILPRLSNNVIAVYVEATGEETETCLLNGLRKRCPSLSDSLKLQETMAALRCGEGIPVGKKMLIVLDQFEQWLHANERDENTELVQALRQCDGRRIQCVVMVRDDFWLSISRFLRELETRLVEGQNSALVDLFDVKHTEKVLAEFGRAFGKLPKNSVDMSKDQTEFLNQAVAGLAHDGKVISIRLALFAEMMKGKSWTPATFDEVGGTEGVGIAFLEETFSVATAPPDHRFHQNAARAVLKTLLPESVTDIKGQMRPYQELLEASGYTNRPKDFDELLRILDGEVRLITPTDADAKDGMEPSTLQAQPGQKYYQLTHDYLVPSIRDWLTRKQREMRRGQTELLLADRAGIWNARPENRQLPSLLQWVQIRWLTQKKNWTPPQRNMMRKAGRYHAVRGMVVGVLLAMTMLTGLAIRDRVEEQQHRTEEKRKATHAEGLVEAVLNADTAHVSEIIGKMGDYRKWIDPLLRRATENTSVTGRSKLHASLALLPVDPGQVQYLHGRLLDAEPHEVPVIGDALASHKDAMLDQLWSVVEKLEKDKKSQRLRAAAALAKYDPESEKWTKANVLVVNDLAPENPVFLSYWSEAFRPIKAHLVSPLSDIFRDHRPERAAERKLATSLLADYAAQQPDVLADLLMDADEKQFAAIFPKFQEQCVRGLPLLIDEIDRKLPASAENNAKEKLAKRQANAAVALLRLNQPATAWPLLKHSPDPRVRSYLIHRLYAMGADAGASVKRLNEEPDITIRRALILSLGEYGEKDLLMADREAVLAKLREIYRTDADPGLHAASEWLLSTWKHEAWLKRIDEDLAKDREKRKKQFDGIKELLTREKEKTPPQWYVNSRGQTMVVIPGPVEFMMGSPQKKYGNELQHKKRIDRTFAIAAKAVTVEQYRQFDKISTFTSRYAPTLDCPIVNSSWYQAAAYCNWLSHQEGIQRDQWCYETDPMGRVTKLKAKYLRLTGYRLPTEAEMEFATRAGAETTRYYGETDEILEKYGWFFENSGECTWPVGSKKPNDLGLFDTHGNVWCWCQERFKSYPKKTSDDEEDELEIDSTVDRVLRGGSMFDPRRHVRSASRYALVPKATYDQIGFRPARTIAP